MVVLHLHRAAAAGYHITLKVLLEGKVDRSTMNNRGKTALELAEENGKILIMKTMKKLR